MQLEMASLFMRACTHVSTHTHTHMRFSLISAGIFRACLRKLELCYVNSNIAGVSVPNRKMEWGFTLPLCWGSHKSNLVQREVVKKREGEKET